MWNYLLAWFVMLLFSVANGALRDLTYGRHLSELAAQQCSTVSGIVMLAGLIWFFMRLRPPSSGRAAMALGLFWMGLTVAFEFLFFHYVGGHAWAELLGNYDVSRGRWWVFELLWLAVAPYLVYRLQARKVAE